MDVKSAQNQRYFDLHAQVCKTIAQAKRLQILYALEEGELSVAELEEKVGISGSSLSQHLTILKQYNVITGNRRGRQLYYRINNDKVMKAIHIMSEMIHENYRDQIEVLDEGKKP